MTFLTLKLKAKELQGHVVRIGEKDFAVVGPLSHEEGGLFFYEATSPGVIFLKRGTVVSEIPVGEPGSTPKTIIYLRTRKIPFAPKRIGKITAVEENKVLFDRGTLHEVHERDIYAIYDSSGRYKGKYEVRGIGDLQSIGKLYSKGKREIEEGDRVVFLGQRKLFNLGLVGGTKMIRQEGDQFSVAGGISYSHTFTSGLGFEAIFGPYYVRRELPHLKTDTLSGFVIVPKGDGYFLLPLSVKYNFFYPRWFSPYVSGGVSVAVFRGHAATSAVFAPVVASGFEFFPGRFFHPRIGVRWFISTRSASGWVERPIFAEVGFITSW